MVTLEKARMYTCAGELENAEHEVSKYLSSYPFSANGYLERGKIRKEKRAYEDAIADLS